MNLNERPISIGNWLISLILVSIPLVNIVMLLVWAFSDGTSESKANWAKASLIFLVLSTFVTVMFWVIFGLGTAILSEM